MGWLSIVGPIALLLLPALLLSDLQPTSADFTFTVRPHNYSNIAHIRSDDLCCILFRFCLQQIGAPQDGTDDSCPLGLYGQGFVNPTDDIIFSPNPVPFNVFLPWPGSAQMYVRVTDQDSIFLNDNTSIRVDDIYVIINNLNPGESTGEITTLGIYRRGRITISFQLACQTNFYDRNCTTYCVPTDGINGHFACGPNGERICLNGWQDPGNRCLTPVCDECHPSGGICTAPGTCSCLPGWSGSQCDQCAQTSPGCSPVGGYCTRPGECRCREGYIGDNCDVYYLNNSSNCIPNPCRNGATCMDTTDSYLCTCIQGYTGANCDVDIDYCFTQPCLNNGTCFDLVAGYICDCLVGWEGDNCSVERDECIHFKPCRNGGNCIDKFDDYECTCAPGFYGRDCELEIDECATNPCQNGNCTNLTNDYSCQCFTNYTGENCEVDLNRCRNSPCHNGGTCQNRPDGFYSCSCPPGYTGFNCESVDHCLSSPCRNQAACMNAVDDYNCICNPGFLGKNCSTALQLVPEQRGPSIGVIVGKVVGGIFSVIVIIIIAVLVLIFYLLKIKKISTNSFSMKVNAAYTKATNQDTAEYYYTNFDDVEMTKNDAYGLSASTHYYDTIQEI